MKKIIMILTFAILLISFTGCGKKITTITDFERYENMTKETDKIEVEFDNHSGAAFCFTITDKKEIDEIMDILFSATFENIGRELPVGDLTTFTIFQGENEYSMSLGVNHEGRYYYSFGTSDLRNKIEALATNAGAYDHK